MEKIFKANKFIQKNKGKVNQKYRLNYHLMGEYGWINDPNGFIQLGGEYHLFYQHNPYEPVWGGMHWGHAVSKDLIKWSYLPIALAPDSPYDQDGCFSGSALEIKNRLYLMYTGFVFTGPNQEKDYRQTQCLAYSEDSRVFKKFKTNPVIGIDLIPDGASKRDFRDPKLIQHGVYYYAFIGSKDRLGNGQVLLYKTKDLLNWQYVSVAAKSDGQMGNTWECPDFFHLGNYDYLLVSPQFMRVQGNDFQNLHSSLYLVGQMNFKNGKFNAIKFYPLDYGFDFYAPQTLLDKQGRRILIAWMNMWDTAETTEKLGHNWAGAMTLPREIISKKGRLYFKPVREIKKYRQERFALRNFTFYGEKVLETKGDCYELQVSFIARDAKEFGIKLRVSTKEETVISYNRTEQVLKFNRDQSGLGPQGERKTKISPINGKLKLRIFVDKSAIEIFINEGEKVMTGRIYPEQDATGIQLFANGECIVESLEKWDLKMTD
jgi:beta-fructofuranosidase